ncbi:MAG: hypothetical protein J5903_00525 [Clostridia bacterium]|nr:hypothetical protein [Clostridia bacterium]
MMNFNTEEEKEKDGEITENPEEENAVVSEESPEEDETPLEYTDEETETILGEEGSLDGDAEEVEALAGEADAPEEDPSALDGATETEEQPEAAEVAKQPVEQTQSGETSDAPTESVDNAEAPVEETGKKEFTLTPPENLEEILAGICTKRARKLIYRPNEAIFEHSTPVLGTDKNNEEKIKIKNILEAEIKQGVKLGYLDKFDGLKSNEIKEEYENDVVYEFAEQEFKRTGLLYDGKKVKVYIFDWDMKACHHVGYVSDESAELLKPYLTESEKYSFDISGIITGGKYKKVTKDSETGKITMEKGNDGKLGLELDITIINRKD